MPFERGVRGLMDDPEARRRMGAKGGRIAERMGVGDG